MAIDETARRLERISGALTVAGVPHALVGGQAVRTTKGVDVLVNREDLPRVRRAAQTAELEYFEVLGVGMLLEHDDPNPRRAVHLLWAGEKVRPEYPLPSPGTEECVELEPGKSVVVLPALVRMKLMANRDQDRVHLRDLIGVGLLDRTHLPGLPEELAARLEAILDEEGAP